MIATDVRRREALSECRKLDGLVALTLSWWEQRRPNFGMLPASLQSVPSFARMVCESAYLAAIDFPDPMKPTLRLVNSSGPDIAGEALAIARFGPALKVRWSSLYDDLCFVAVSGTPSYHVVQRSFHPDHVNYRRLILPLGGDGMCVSQLLVLSSPGPVS